MECESTTYKTVTPSEAMKSIQLTWERFAEKGIHRAQSRLYRALFCDIAQQFPNFASLDFTHLLSLIDNWGESSYLDSFSSLGKLVETSLITGENLVIPTGWKMKKGTRLPKFCYQLFKELFNDDGSPSGSIDISTGTFMINNHGCSEAQLSRATSACLFLRQMFMMWSKAEVYADVNNYDLSTPSAKACAKTKKAVDDFVKRVSNKHAFINADCYGTLREARRLLRTVFNTASPERDELVDFIVKPWGRHGPGAVAGREHGGEKWSFNKWPGLPHQLFSWRDGCDCEVAVVEKQPAARLCVVPKDFRGPRVICIEPKENQFAQQGLMDILYRLVHRCSLTNRSISFLDVEDSRRACYDYKFATIDLKDASDCISLALARLILPRWVFKLVTRYRSRGIITPIGLVESGCLATMGNATCFPLETLIFWAIALGAMIEVRESFHARQRKYLNLEIRVFGDDIIVPIWACDYVARMLTAAGLVINTNKTCAFSPVRESCGEWVYNGREIKIVRFKSLDVVDHRSFTQWLSLYKDLDVPCVNKYMGSLREEILSILKDYWERQKKTYKKFGLLRYNRSLCRMEIYAPSLVQRGRLQKLDGYTGLYAWHVHNDGTPYLRGAHNRVKMRWQDSTYYNNLL